MSKPKTKTAVRRRRPEEVRDRIMEAALEMFAVHGFEGAIMQNIARQAGISLSLLVYHFKSKKNLWRETVGHEAERFYRRAAVLNDTVELTATERLRGLLSSLVELCAERPQLNRIIALEGYRKSERMTWLANKFGRSRLEAVLSVIAAAQAEGGVRPNLSPLRLRYALLGVATLPSLGAEFRELTGRDVAAREEIDASLQFIYDLIFIEKASKTTRRKKV